MRSIKKHNQMQARMHRQSRTMLRENGLCVVFAEIPTEQHGIFSAKTMLPVRGSPVLVSMICDFPHRWVIYLAAFCRDQRGERYMKSVEIEPQGQYKSDQLEPVLREQYGDLLAMCNQQHIQGGGWIASPIGQQFTEQEAARVFESFGVWRDASEEAA